MTSAALDHQQGRGKVPPLFFWGVLLSLGGVGCHLAALCAILLWWLATGSQWPYALSGRLTLMCGVPTILGGFLIAIDLLLFLPEKRRTGRRPEGQPVQIKGLTVGLTAYNDEDSIHDAVRDFISHPKVLRVIVVSNNSRDRTEERARAAGAIVFNEESPGYGRCVWRCLHECLNYDDSEWVVLCEGDRTFRAMDLEKFIAYLPHADVVNGTRIVEQLRAYSTQLNTFMFYGNLFAGKLLEAKHLGKGTFTDVGTTYKVVRREALAALLPKLDPSINLEFNAHFMDTVLSQGIPMLECPVTFHPRVGVSKGGNVNTPRALKVGLRMMLGLIVSWRLLRGARGPIPKEEAAR